jgi:serine/threonine protein kinase
MPSDHPRSGNQTSPTDVEILSHWLAEFEQSWAEGRLAACVQDLPPPGSPLRLPALVGMIKVDLKRRWKLGQRVKVESYLETYPELGTPETAPVDLVQAEYEARQQSGEAVTASQFRLRFPRQALQLQQPTQPDSDRPTPPGPSTHSTRTPDPSAAPPGGDGPAKVPGSLPEQFGRYRILQCLGKGGMGTVYLAHDTSLDRRVALKVPHWTTENSPQALARFLQEARAASALRHANICPVYDVGEAGGVPYLTMAYIEGRPLSEVARSDGPAPQQQAAALVRTLALALEEAHQCGILHRDLKPSNVMITPRGEPVIMDFGLARRVNQAGARLTHSGMLLGTPAYMAPEQVTGERGAVGPQADVYSLGVILYELLTGRLPFDGPLAVVLARVLTAEPAPPSAHRPDLDPALEAIWRQATAKKPADRFATMGQFAAALEAYLRGETPSPAGRPQRKPPPAPQPAPADLAPPADGTLAMRPRPDEARLESPAPARWRNGPAAGPPRRWLVVAGALLLVGAGAALWLIWKGLPNPSGQPVAVQTPQAAPPKQDGSEQLTSRPASAEKDLALPAWIDLLAVRGAKQSTVGVALWLTDPLELKDVPELGRLTKALQAEGATLRAAGCPDAGQRNVLEQAREAAHSAAQVLSDVRPALDDKSVDAAVILGFARGAEVQAGLGINKALTFACQSGKDVYAANLGLRPPPWQPAANDDVLRAALQSRRLVWIENGAANDYGGFLQCVKSRARGRGDIRNLSTREGPKDAPAVQLSRADEQRAAVPGKNQTVQLTSNQKIQLVDAASGLLWSLDLKTNVSAVCVTADGRRVYAAYDKGLLCLDARTGKEIIRKPLNGGAVRVAVAPDGRRVVVSSASEVMCFDDLGGLVWKTGGGPCSLAVSADGSVVFRLDLGKKKLGCLRTQDGKSLWAADLTEDYVMLRTAKNGTTLLLLTSTGQTHRAEADRNGLIKGPK